MTVARGPASLVAAGAASGKAARHRLPLRPWARVRSIPGALGATVVSTLLIAGAPAAQDVPNFTGQWQREDKNDIGSGWGDALAIAQNARELLIEYALFARTDMQPPLRFLYDLSGGETTNSVMMGRGLQHQTSRARWSGDRLNVTTSHEFVHEGKLLQSEVRQVLWLQSPASLVIETTRGGMLGGPSTSSRSVYRRLEHPQ